MTTVMRYQLDIEIGLDLIVVMDTIVYDYHTYSKLCKNKLVVLITEWLPWLLTRWRNIGDEKFFGIRD